MKCVNCGQHWRWEGDVNETGLEKVSPSLFSSLSSFLLPFFSHFSHFSFFLFFLLVQLAYFYPRSVKYIATSREAHENDEVRKGREKEKGRIKKKSIKDKILKYHHPNNNNNDNNNNREWSMKSEPT